MGNCISPSPPKSQKTVSSLVMADILSNQLHLNEPPGYLSGADSDYGILRKSDVERFLKSNKVDKLKYKAESFDCDDFSRALTGDFVQWYSKGDVEGGAAFGYLYGQIYWSPDDPNEKVKYHAICFFIDEKEKVWLIEPQNDKMYEPNQRSIYSAVFI